MAADPSADSKFLAGAAKSPGSLDPVAGRS
uniref:Uncharacterized protein n=1 Tax=Anopheles minimus TaxID=112268 RepID=A0A182WP51_9DIPT